MSVLPGRGIPPLWLSLKFLPSPFFFWMEGLRTEDVHCTDCRAHWVNVIVMLDYKIKLIWFDSESGEPGSVLVCQIASPLLDRNILCITWIFSYTKVNRKLSSLHCCYAVKTINIYCTFSEFANCFTKFNLQLQKNNSFHYNHSKQKHNFNSQPTRCAHVCVCVCICLCVLGADSQLALGW